MFGTQEPDVYFYGETLQKLGEQKYKITRGGFTTCLQPTPRWELTSRSVTLNLEHYAILTNSLFKVKGVPVFYMPIFYYPVQKDDRATGFLIPTYGASTIRGQSLSNAFFWAISRSQDLTLLHDWLLEDGPGLRHRIPVRPRPRAPMASMRFYTLREHEAQYDDTTTPARQSYEVRGAGTQRISKRGAGAVPRRLLLRHRRCSRRITRTCTTRRADSASSAGRSAAPGASTTSPARSTAASISTARRAPRSAAGRRACWSTGTSGRCSGASPTSSVNSEYNRLIVERKTETELVDQSLTRYDLLPRIRIPFTKWQFLTANSTVGVPHDSLDGEPRPARPAGRAGHLAATTTTCSRR